MNNPMTPLEEVFLKHSDKYAEFDGMDKDSPNRLHSSPDICGLLILDRLAPITTWNTSRILLCNGSGAYLRVDLEVLTESATEQDVEDLLRCGIRYSIGYDHLYLSY